MAAAAAISGRHSSRTYHHRASIFFAPPSSPAATTVNSPEFHHKSRAPFPQPPRAHHHLRTGTAPATRAPPPSSHKNCNARAVSDNHRSSARNHFRPHLHQLESTFRFTATARSSRSLHQFRHRDAPTTIEQRCLHLLRATASSNQNLHFAGICTVTTRARRSSHTSEQPPSRGREKSVRVKP